VNEADFVVVCVVTWNGGEVALHCLESVVAQTYPNFCTVVVDNDSFPADREALRTWSVAHPGVEIVWNSANVGFAAAANQGLEYARTQGAPWMLLVTQDTVLEPDALNHLVDAVRGPERIAIAGPVVVDRGTGQVLSLGERTSPWLLAFPRRLVRYRRADSPYRLVTGLVGCCLLLATELVHALGGFREELFAYYEEVDLCLRVRAAGYRIAIVPASCVYHDGWRGYLAAATPTSALLKARNLLLVSREHLRPWHWVVVGPSMTGLFLATMLGFVLRRQWRLFGALCRGIWMGVRGHGGKPRLPCSECE